MGSLKQALVKPIGNYLKKKVSNDKDYFALA